MAIRTLQRIERAAPAPRPRRLREVRAIPTRVDWRRQPSGFRTSHGQTFLLLGVRKSCCARCRFGTRWETAWGPCHGEPVEISWCESCFNATYDPAELTAAQRAYWRRLQAKIHAGSPLQCGSAARPVIDDLKRRGLL